MTAPLDAGERAAIVEEWRRRQAAWKPQSGRVPGCLIALAGLVLLPVLPKLLLPKASGAALLTCVGLMAIGLALAGTRRIPYDPQWLIEDSIRALTGSGTGTDDQRRAAVALLFHYADVDGPTARTLFDAADVRTRLGPGIGYVEAVERVLREEQLSGAVFLPGGQSV